MADFDVLVLGDANPDLVLRGDVHPAFGQVEKLVDEALLVVGGSGAIMACGAARLGLATAFCGVVGDDAFGRFMLDALGDAGVDTAAVAVSRDRPTGLSVILSEGEDRAILTSTGTIDALDTGTVDLDLVRAVRHVHVSSYFLQRGLQAGLPGLFEEAHRAGATTSLDPNWDAGETWDSGLRDLGPAIDVFLPNAAEALAIAEADDVSSAARALSRRSEIVAVKCGREGGLAMRGRETARVAPPPVAPVDTVGAGDTFDAGFVAGRLAGWPLDRCLQVAVACGSLSTRGVGGTATQPTMDDALAALEHMP
jgi:sugar/nucleoside kinase (ribokinase family)